MQLAQAAEASTARCPVCLTEFPPPRDGAAFALHVVSCAAPPSEAATPTPTPPMRSCPMCQHVYARGTLPHEVSFHEHECARVNERPRDSLATNKRQREAPASAATGGGASSAEDDEDESAPAVRLFPSECFVCGAGGRSLLRCEGTCARVFHLHCVEDLQAALPAGAGAADGGASARRAQQQSWTCAECFRGTHRCFACGFLGSDAKDLVRCAVADCGRFFHRACLPEDEPQAFVCPRHACAKCGALETDMARCVSCVKCDVSTHLRCRPGASHAADGSPHVAAAAVSATPGANANLHVCSSCVADRPTVKPSAHLGNSFRRRCANGDVVLILEYNNAILPASSRSAASGVYNYWGVVTSVESMEPAGAGNQLLSVTVFSDDSRIVVPNRYVLRVASANSFATPSAMVRELIKWHAMTELNLRASESDLATETCDATLESSCKAFAARLDALGISTSVALAQASKGDESLQKFLQQTAPRCYREESDAKHEFAPVYLFLDTRPGKSTMANRASKVAQPSQQSGSAGAPPPADGDVDMDQGGEESKTEEAADQPTGSGAGASPNAATRATGSTEPPNDDIEHEAGKDHGEEEVDAVDEERASSDENVLEAAVEVMAAVADDADKGDVSASRNDEVVAVDLSAEGGGKTSDETMPIPTDVEAPRDNTSEATDTATIAVNEAQFTVTMETEAQASESTIAVSTEEDARVTESDLLGKKTAKEEDSPAIVFPSPIEDSNESKSAALFAEKLSDVKDTPASDVAMVSPEKRASTFDAEDPAPVKRAKVALDVVKQPLPLLSMGSSKFEPLPAVSTFNITQVMPTFSPQLQFEKPARISALPSGGARLEKPRKLTHKEAVLAEFPPALISELERDVGDYLEHGNAGMQREHRLPKDADSFPWAAHAALFRPAFYRPTVVLNRARGGRRIDGVSRLLVSQDKRNLRCFIQSAQHALLACPSSGASSASHHAFLTVDLVSVESFAQLMAAVRSKLLVALEDRPRFTQELFQMEPRAALRWLEQQQSRKLSEQQLGMTLWYCCFDGSRKAISLDEQPSRKATSEWLCFCSNACHLTLALSLPPIASLPAHSGISRGMASAVAVRGL